MYTPFISFYLLLLLLVVIVLFSSSPLSLDRLHLDSDLKKRPSFIVSIFGFSLLAAVCSSCHLPWATLYRWLNARTSINYLNRAQFYCLTACLPRRILSIYFYHRGNSGDPKWRMRVIAMRKGNFVRFIFHSLGGFGFSCLNKLLTIFYVLQPRAFCALGVR